MNAPFNPDLTPRVDAQVDQIMKLAIFAVGGQGGGVLNGWIVNLAEQNGFDVQATSIAGVAQRTGATIYYVEMLAKSGATPVFSLSPTEGDIDILIASEIMEAGRAITRGFVTPIKTTVITSTHRMLATLEKTVPGNGTADKSPVMDALAEQAETVLAFDMQQIAEEEGTVISAALFGALAGSGVLPFDVESFRATVAASGRGVDRSLAAFERACALANGTETEQEAPVKIEPVLQVNGPKALLADWESMLERVSALPMAVRETAKAGLRKTAEFQDVDYAGEYLKRIEEIQAKDLANGGDAHGFTFTQGAAKHLANAMAYDDIIRVADAKTRAGRMARIEAEVGATDVHLTHVTEYTHPGAPEVISMMPRRLGQWAEARPKVVKTIDRLVNRGRHIRTDTLRGFLPLYWVAGLRRWRRAMLRHGQEMAHIDAWLTLCEERLAMDYDFAVHSLAMRRLIKGYSDTHARGLSKFDRVSAATALIEGRDDASDWTRRLIDAALADPDGEQLDGAIQTIRSFTT